MTFLQRCPVFVLFLWGVTACAQDREVVFQAEPNGSASGVARVVEPADGQYVYSRTAPGRRATVRFPIGVAPRTDFTIYSAEEQHEFQAIRERAAAAAEPPTSAPVRSRALAHLPRQSKRLSTCAPASKAVALATAAGPKVVQDGDKVCVPALAFADLPDWRNHLLCINKGDGSVR